LKRFNGRNFTEISFRQTKPSNLGTGKYERVTSPVLFYFFRSLPTTAKRTQRAHRTKVSFSFTRFHYLFCKREPK
jgi:hypothetical protein